jgi:hypothetical protein
LFLKACLFFFPWLAGRLHNFELTQNREKKNKWPYIKVWQGKNGMDRENLAKHYGSLWILS